MDFRPPYGSPAPERRPHLQRVFVLAMVGAKSVGWSLPSMAAPQNLYRASARLPRGATRALPRTASRLKSLPRPIRESRSTRRLSLTGQRRCPRAGRSPFSNRSVRLAVLPRLRALVMALTPGTGVNSRFPQIHRPRQLTAWSRRERQHGTRELTSGGNCLRILANCRVAIRHGSPVGDTRWQGLAIYAPSLPPVADILFSPAANLAQEHHISRAGAASLSRRLRSASDDSLLDHHEDERQE